MSSPDQWSGHQLFSDQAATVEKQAARCKRQQGYGFVLNPEKEAALTGHANMEWKYKYSEMREKKQEKG